MHITNCASLQLHRCTRQKIDSLTGVLANYWQLDKSDGSQVACSVLCTVLT